MEERSAVVRSTQVIAVGNQKGGVGKTTNTCQIATALAEMGRLCLIIDLDMNAGATRHFGIPTKSFMGSFEMMLGEEEPEDVILRNGDADVELPENLHVIPARRDLEGLDQAIAKHSKFVVPHDTLIGPIRKLRGHYDYIFLDTPPNAPTPTIGAYKAADWFLLAAMPNRFAIEGLEEALTDIRDAQQHANPRLRLLGVVVAGVDSRTSIAKRLTEYVQNLFAVDDKTSAKFKTIIPHSTVLPQAQEVGKTIFQTVPRHHVTDQFRALAKEIEQRIQAAPKLAKEIEEGRGVVHG